MGSRAVPVRVPFRRMRSKWVPIAILAAAQFVMVLDSSVMNVSISQIVEDLDTTIQGVQLAITAYTLVMAAFMLVGAKLGDIWGRDRAFAIGLAVYAAGSLITALSPNLAVLLFGWSLVEGLGAVLVIPAIAALIAANYEGKERALAYGIIGGVAAAAIAAGPLIGGWVTTNYTWRLVFVGEVVIVAVILLFRQRMKPSPPRSSTHRASTSSVPACRRSASRSSCSASCKQHAGARSSRGRPVSSTAGRSRRSASRRAVPDPRRARPACRPSARGGAPRAARRATAARPRAPRHRHLRAGLSTLAVQQLVLLGTFFVLPVYLQVVLGLDAFETGLRLVPMSVDDAHRRADRPAAGGPPLAQGGRPARASCRSPSARSSSSRRSTSSSTSPGSPSAWRCSASVPGLLASQLGNVIMSAAPPDQTNEAGGLQGTAQNLGASLGTALIGAILLIGLTSCVRQHRRERRALPEDHADRARGRGPRRPASRS